MFLTVHIELILCKQNCTGRGVCLRCRVFRLEPRSIFEFTVLFTLMPRVSMFTPQTFLIQERDGVKKILSIFSAKPLQKITIKLLIKSLQTGSWASGENCWLRDGSRHLPSRLLPQGRQGHASSEVDASRGIPRRNLHFKNRRLVSLLTSWNKKWTTFHTFF